MRALFVSGACCPDYRHLCKIRAGRGSSVIDRLSSRPNVVRINLNDFDVSPEA